MAKSKASKKKAGSKAKKKPTKYATQSSVASLSRQLQQLKKQLLSAMPVHMKAASAAPLTGFRRVGVKVDSGPDIVNVWVEDELVLHQGKRVGESRPRPIGEVITLTVEAVGNDGDDIVLALTRTDRTPFADTVPPNGHYEGGNRYTVT